MNNLEVDEPRPAGALVIDDIGHGRVRVRPATTKSIAPQLMSAAELFGGRFDHLPVQYPTSHVVPQIAARQLIRANRARAYRKSTKPVSVEHFY